MIFFLLLLLGSLAGKGGNGNGGQPPPGPFPKKKGDVDTTPSDAIPVECIDGLKTESTPQGSWSQAYWLYDTANSQWVTRFGFAKMVDRRWVICLEPAGSRYIASIWRQVPGKPVEHSYRSPVSHRSREWATGEADIAREILKKGMDPAGVDSPNNGLTSLKRQRQGPG